MPAGLQQGQSRDAIRKVSQAYVEMHSFHFISPLIIIKMSEDGKSENTMANPSFFIF